MVPSLRLVQLIALGSPLWLLAAAFPAGWLVGVAYLVLLGAASAAEYRSLPDTTAFGVARDLARFSLGAVAEVRVSLTNRSSRLLHVSLRDELPAGLQQVAAIPEVRLDAKGRGECAYQVRCLRRGRYRLDDVVVRVRRPGALIARQLRIPASVDIRVYPRFATADEYYLLARMNERDEDVRRPRRVYGRGTDFESLSNYYPGEDLRMVDWKISAKRGHLIARNLQTERGQQISVMIDGGRLMALKIGEFSRFEHALNAAVMLSYVAQKRGDAIAVATFSDRVESLVPPTRGTSVMPRVLDSLCAVQVRQVESDYWQVVGEVMEKLKRRSLLIMMTDLLDSASSAGLMANLARAASRHLVLCVVLTDPRMADVADSEPKTVRDTYLKAAAAHLMLERELALGRMRSRGILTLEASPEQLTVRLIRRYLEIRRANLQ